MLYLLIWEAQYEGQALGGVYETREAAQAALDENFPDGGHDFDGWSICEVEVGRFYGFLDQPSEV